MLKAINLIFACVILVTCYQEINGECCKDNTTVVKYMCKYLGRIDQICEDKLCMDGTVQGTFGYCAVGSCDMLGCNCDGGCLKGTPETAVAAYKKAYPDLNYIE